MRIKLIACKVLTRELSELAAQSPNVIDITWVRQGYHNEPDRLREILQRIIDGVDRGDDFGTGDREVGEFDAICLGYGLCSNGTAGLGSQRYPLVIPRVHDCISLFLGSAARYKALFDEMAGAAYWYTPGWIEQAVMPHPVVEQRALARYTELYGEENARYLADMESVWYKDYKFAAYIRPHNSAYPDHAGYVREAAEHFGWDYVEHQGDLALLEAMCSGAWDERFLVVPPGERSAPDYEGGILRVADADE